MKKIVIALTCVVVISVITISYATSNNNEDVVITESVPSSESQIDQSTMKMLCEEMLGISEELNLETFGESSLLVNDERVGTFIKSALEEGGFDSTCFDTKSEHAKFYKCELVRKSKMDQPVEVVALFDNGQVQGLFLNYHAYMPGITPITYKKELV